ncbi:hypothetical protein RRV45_04155 [Bacillus sp. DTU_2020_1000418_1_SI_GHA_SEK_038]|uniref:hypothetical protein n=1 Tax=Bacillus sp. DTU_2020_1000418_1_SI_GHA_SEK_038 TaxID=3077585 RepID=UPI0028E4971F|nr:hypothetical protein [Bacillus sp. DTU_2020_1000418_1_SI_GHA_SEK_038]WNS76211.1 hypothetical protein RRV45_04155 [Bacillus sp. DTU_2020_1000418_1_SI_GHA_SEK_038]
MKVLGYILFAIGIWMMVSPQATLGLKELKWMADYAFPGEALIGSIVVAGSLMFFGNPKSKDVKHNKRFNS